MSVSPTHCFRVISVCVCNGIISSFEQFSFFVFLFLFLITDCVEVVQELCCFTIDFVCVAILFLFLMFSVVDKDPFLICFTCLPIILFDDSGCIVVPVVKVE